MLFSGLIWLLLRQQRQTEHLLAAQSKVHRDVQLQQLDVIEKAFAQLRSTDPWQYQAIQVMNQNAEYDKPYDPSEEAEAKRIAQRQNAVDDMEESLNGYESAALDDIFPGSGL